MANSRFEELQEMIRSYGSAAFENLVRCKAIGDAIVDQFPAYLGCSKDCVRAAPPAGEYDPKRDYGDDAFSFAHRKVIVLEPIHFGLALTIKNFEDSGSMWLRTAIAIEVTGDSFDIFVAQQPVIHVPLEFSGKLEPVLEAIHNEFLDTFSLQVLKFNDKRFENGIGFFPES